MSVLVVLEQQAGEWHRMAWETLAAAQQFGAALGVPVDAAVVGSKDAIQALAAEAIEVDPVLPVDGHGSVSFECHNYPQLLAFGF